MGYQIGPGGFSIKYTGQYRDLETNLDYFNARYYSPQPGRFVSPDRSWECGGARSVRGLRHARHGGAMQMRSLVSTVIVLVLIFPGLTQAQQPLRKRNVLNCAPSVVARDETLMLSLAIPHPGEVAVLAPDGTWYLLVYEPDNGIRVGPPLVDKKEFSKMKELRFVISQAVGVPLVVGHLPIEKIFTKSGVYTILLADSVASDQPQETYRCRVRLVGLERKSRHP